MSEVNFEEKELPLVIKNLTKRFKTHLVLDNVSLQVNPGEIYGLVGLNGVGKTTMIKLMLDLLRPNHGEILFFGHHANHHKARRFISYLPEKFYPSPFLRGEEFLSLTLSYFKKEYKPEKAALLAKLLDLDSKVLAEKISRYSKGMAQKLGLLSVFLADVPLLILDEPMSGLDPNARIELKWLLKDYAKRGGSVFFSSHILGDLDEICDRISVINNTKIIYTGTPAVFREKFTGDSLESSFLKAIGKDHPDMSILEEYHNS